MRKISLFLLAVFLSVFFFSCAASSFFALNIENPCVIENAVHVLCVNGFDSCVRFDMRNDSKEKIESVTVTFSLNDEDGSSMLVSGSTVTVTAEVFAEADESFSFDISADFFLLESPDEPYNVDFAYINSIRYVSGHVWHDFYGMYSAVEREKETDDSE